MQGVQPSRGASRGKQNLPMEYVQGVAQGTESLGFVVWSLEFRV